MPPSQPPLADHELYNRLRPITVPSSSPRSSFTNWGLSYTCKPLVVFEPESEEQCELILELARREGQKVRAAGVGHSPSDLACTSGYMVRTERLNRVLEVNPEKQYVTAQAGITLNALHAVLAEHNLAMINVGSISDQTLAGVVTTATHATGVNFRVISTHVLSLLLLLPDGTRVHCSRTERKDLFLASLCGLGSTGLILQIQLEVGPAFRLKETQESMPFDRVVDRLDELSNASEHVRMMWFPQADVIRVSSADRTFERRKPATSFLWHSILGFHLVQFLFFLGIYFPAINPWICRMSAWLDRAKTVTVDDSWRVFNLDCKYPQFTTEWAIPYKNTKACLRDLRRWLDEEHADPNGLRPHFPLEIRFSAADDIWLSPSYGQETTWIGIIQYKPYGLNVPYRKLFERFESIMSRYGGRPHWAKAHRLRPDGLRVLYPRFDEFVRVIQDVDPQGMFRNEYVERHLFGKEGPQYHERVYKALQ
ncbi:L-gulonolactone/D-arabinono-1,4-lactone oxidase [Panus rudis PR-1116 ss-1]|nr:L-gulonolactone/D-arabinono-1,4-lactone oxidase [Panus rudis PR-1116 ss-1]